jgi:hypothetical protein
MSDTGAGSRGRGSRAVRNTFRKELELALVDVKVKAERIEQLIAERDALRKWAAEACVALGEAAVIRQGEHDRLLGEARELGVPVPSSFIEI